MDYTQVLHCLTHVLRKEGLEAAMQLTKNMLSVDTRASACTHGDCLVTYMEVICGNCYTPAWGTCRMMMMMIVCAVRNVTACHSPLPVFLYFYFLTQKSTNVRSGFGL